MLRDVVLLWRDRVVAGVSAEGPCDAMVLLERDRTTLRDVVLLQRDGVMPSDGGVLLQRDCVTPWY